MTATFDAFAVRLAGRNVVDASAGTGKTYAITSLVTRLVIERRLRIKDILVVTFTEAATSQLRDRVRRRLSEAFDAFTAVGHATPLRPTDLHIYAQRRKETLAADMQWLALALQEVDEAPISTIHGFCHRVLQEAALESGVPFEADLIADARPLRDETINDFHSKDLAAQPIEDVRALLQAEPAARRLWQGLADKLLRSPDAKILPTDPFERDKAWTQLRGKLQAVWDRKQIERLMTTKVPDFKAPAVRYLEPWFDQIDQLLAAEFPPSEAPAAVGHFSCGLMRAKRGAGAPEHPAFVVIEDICALLSAKAGPSAVVAAKHRFATFFHTELAARKETLGAITFDDLLLHLRQALRGPAAHHLVRAVRQRFKAALIDEFQDTDPVQFEIFAELFKGTDEPLFLIGDPKQAIYGFRGADVNAYIQAVQAEGTHHHSMGVNWRSDPSLVAAVNALFAARADLAQPFVIPGIGFVPVSARADAVASFATDGKTSPVAIDVMLTVDEDGSSFDPKVPMARLVAADISRLLAGNNSIAGKRVEPADIAVLTRTNQQAVDVQRELRALQIPAVLLGDKSVLDSDEAKELLVVLAAAVEPTNASLLRRALATQLMGLGAFELVSLEEDAAGWAVWSEAFRQWHEVWVTQGFVQMFRRWLDHEAVAPRLLGLIDGERRTTNLLHLMELIHRAAREGHLGPAGVLHWLGQAPTNAEGGVAPEEAQIRLESDEAAVKLTTVHRAKGLEYPIVYCPYMANEALTYSSDEKVVRFHDDDGEVLLDIGSAQLGLHFQTARKEALAENIRLLYVALTRAKHRCVLLWGYASNLKETALASLLYPLQARGANDDGTFLGSLGGTQSVAQLMAPLQAWSERCGGAVNIRQVSRDEKGIAYVDRAALPALLPPLEVDAKVGVWQRTTSFSAMTANVDHSTNTAEAFARDRDSLPSVMTMPDPAAQTVPLASFPRGAKAGNFFHELLEVAAFDGGSESFVPAVKAQLQLYRYAEEPWLQMVPRALQDVLTTPLDDGRGPFALRDIPANQRISELEFALPLTPATAAGTLQEQLQKVFTVDAVLPHHQRYAARVGQLHLGVIQGFVKGFIDLVFEHKGRFFVLDYKTNHLGSTWQNYEGASLEAAMVDGHYHLQSHLYSLAVSRHLARTVRGYDPATHFGGVFYLFLRGMGGPDRPSSGVYFQRPSRARLAALDATFTPGEPLS